MIRSFSDKELEKIYNQTFSRKIPHNIQKATLKKLLMINAANTINDLRIPPSNHLEELRGDRKGKYSIRVNNQYRICFKEKNGEFYELELVDYH